MLSGGKGVDGERSELAESGSKNQRNPSSLENAHNFWEKLSDQSDVTRPNFCAANERGKIRQNFGLSNHKISPKLED